MSTLTAARQRMNSVAVAGRRAAGWPLALICAAQFVLQLDISIVQPGTLGGVGPPIPSSRIASCTIASSVPSSTCTTEACACLADSVSRGNGWRACLECKEQDAHNRPSTTIGLATEEQIPSSSRTNAAMRPGTP